MVSFKSDEIVILLGAGASVEAKIPHSAEMVKQIEEKISLPTGHWNRFQQLYHYIRSSIYFSDGIHGKFEGQVNYNIERLVDTLNEISMRSEHTLYPFVGAWNPTLVEVAGEEFSRVRELRDEIITILRTQWLAVENYRESAAYYRGLIDFQAEYQYPLRVFSLNYDLCLERTCQDCDIGLERGFNDKRQWDWRQFDVSPDLLKEIYLYKLHGSIDWTYRNDQLTFYDDPGAIDEAAIIFGTSYKLQYRDPFLFLTYEFRRWTLESRIIVAIGYGFGDPHINKIIQQALHNDKERKLLAVLPLKHTITEDTMKAEICHWIDFTSEDQVAVFNGKAADFMTKHLHLEKLSSYLNIDGEELFPTVSSSETN